MSREYMNCPNGYDVWQMGGGCRAYGRTFASKNFVLITDSNGTDLPSRNDIQIGVYPEAGDDTLDLMACDHERQMLALIEISEELYG